MSNVNSLVPRTGHTLMVGVVARISGGVNQKELSLDDQVDHSKEVIAEMYDGPVEYITISTTAKGERLDRPELAQLENLLRSRTLDVLICEDIGRVVRGADAVRLCGIAVDHGVRVLAPNDCIDTADETWEEEVISASRDHVGHNAQTSKRIKHKLMNRFTKLGAATPLPVFGVIKPPGAKTFDEWRIDPDATPILNELYNRLLEKPNASAAADWLNSIGVKPGRYARLGEWDGPMVLRLVRNSILKGIASRGKRHTVKRNETGRRVSERNPKGPRFRACPHLRQVEPDLWDRVNERVNSVIDAKGGGPKATGRDHDRWNVSRSRSPFPGQHAHCAYCGRKYYWGANGQAGNLICSGGKNYYCWNSIGVKGKKVVEMVCDAVLAELATLDGLDAQFREIVAEARKVTIDPGSATLEQERAELKRKKENLLASLAEYGPRPMLKEKLVNMEAQEQKLARRAESLARAKPVNLPDSPAELRCLFEQKFKELAKESWEFGDLLRQVVPDVEISLVRLLDGGHLFPRVKIKLALAGIVRDAERVPKLDELLTREVTLDAFDPPQREQIRVEAVQQAAAGVTQREIAARLGVKQMAVFNALALNKRMLALGLETPYVLVTSPPDDYPKLKRHRHPRYKFTPLDGYGGTSASEGGEAS